MATTRKKSSGFSASSEDISEIIPVEESPEVEQVEDITPPPVVVITETFREESIVPTEDLGPRFIEEPQAPKPEPKKTPELKPKPQRHPRNVPRFSRTR